MPRSWFQTARLLCTDHVLQIGLLVYGLATLVHGLGSTRMGGLTSLTAFEDTVLLAMTLVALVWGRRWVTGRERRFWDLLALSWSCLLLVEVFFFLELPTPLVSASFVADNLYILFYLSLALAVDSRPHVKAEQSLTLVRRRLESVAGVTAIFGLMTYFAIVVLPEPLGLSLSFVSREQGLTPLLLVRLSLDLLLLGRLLYAAHSAQGRWSRLYLVLASAMFCYGLRDTLSVLQSEGLLSLGALGFGYEAFLHLPGILVIIAARYRHLPFPDRAANKEVSAREDPAEKTRPSPLALYALVVPGMHFLLYPLGVLEPASRSAREVFSLIYVMVLGGLAWAHQRVLAQDNRRSREALRVAEERLSRSQRLEAVGRLAGGVAHDFNNYLTVIRGYSELLRKRLENQDARIEIGYIEDAARKATHLTRQLLAFGRRQVLRPEPLEVNQVVVETSKLLTRLLGEDVKLDLALDSDTGLARADLGQTEQVLMNLALNARDAMQGGGKITVRTYRSVIDDSEAARLEIEPGPYVSLDVSDTGCGMTEEVRAQIFEPFFTTKEHGRGTGLGLSTVHGIVTQSGGAISADSAPGQGTTMHVWLPAAAHSDRSAERQSPELEPEPEAATLLLVEDEAQVRGLAAKALRRNGFRVLEAASGEEVISSDPEDLGSVDLLIADVLMPGMDGVELAATLLARLPTLRVLFVSGYPSEMLREQRSALPISTRLLEKPYTPTVLLKTVREVLSEPRQHTEIDQALAGNH